MLIGRKLTLTLVALLCWLLVGFEHHAFLVRQESDCVANLYKLQGTDGFSNVTLSACMLSQRTWGPLEYMLVFPALVSR